MWKANSTLIAIVAIFCSSQCPLARADDHGKCSRLSSPRLFGTKTLYEDARNAIRQLDDDDLPKPFDDDSLEHEHKKLIKDDCEPVAFYFFGRHSARFPDGEDIDKYNADLNKLIESIRKTPANGDQRNDDCRQLRQEILNWKSKMQSKHDNLITEPGAQEERNIARRFKRLYPDFFDGRKADIKIGVTEKIRTAQTGSEFLKEVEGLNLDQSCRSTPTNDPSRPDYSLDKVLDATCYKYLTDKHKMPILDFHKQCEKIGGGEDKRKDPLTVRVKDPKLLHQMANRVGKKLGLQNTAGSKPSDPIISVDMLDSIWNMCKFEVAMQNSSIWCNLFERKDVAVMEYIEDVKTYLDHAYGPRANSRQSCPVVSNLVGSFQDTIKRIEARQAPRKQAFFYFSHAGPFKKLLAAFGLFRDDKNFKSDRIADFESDLKVPKKRNWRASLVSPFSANLAFILYRCPSSSSPSKNKFKVLASVTEQPVKLGGCSDTDCNTQRFMATYNNMLDCDLSQICRRS